MFRKKTSLAIALAGFFFNGCSEGIPSLSQSNNRFLVGGTVTGLEGSMILRLEERGDRLSITENGPFVFPNPLPEGDSYRVEIQSVSGPEDQYCTVEQGSGIVEKAVNSVRIVCSRYPQGNSEKICSKPKSLGTKYSLEDLGFVCLFAIGGTVSGLNGTLVLQNNGGDDLTITANGPFTFSQKLGIGNSYQVSIASQPAGQYCELANQSGTVQSTDVSDIVVLCRNTYTVGGTVSGLSGTLVIQNNGGDDLTIAANGPFTFPTPIPDGDIYKVSIVKNPSSQTCKVEDGDSVVQGANITNVQITCTSTANGFTWIQDAYLKASNAGAGDYFGSAVAISGSTIVVGARGEDSPDTTINNTDGSAQSAADGGTTDDSGALYVFQKDNSGNWYQDAYIKASNPSAYDVLGWDVAISGHIIVAGAQYEESYQTTITNQNNSASNDDSGYRTGAAYVFVRDSSGNWYQDAYLKAPNAEDDELFAANVDVDGTTIVIGAQWEDASQTTITNEDNTANADNSSLKAGAVYVFERDLTGTRCTIPPGEDSCWYLDAYLKASNSRDYDLFGRDVAVFGNTIVVSAEEEDSDQTTITNTDGAGGGSGYTKYNSGAVYIFQKDAQGNWFQDAYIKASNADSGDKLGSSISIFGSTVVVGTFNEASSQTTITNTNGTASSDNTATLAGAVYVFEKDTAGTYCTIPTGETSCWYQDAYIKASNIEGSDQFGFAVDIYGHTLVVGARFEDSSDTTINNTDGNPTTNNNTTADSGAVYVFQKDAGGNWYQDAYLKPSNTGGSDYFGSTVAISGATIVVGAPYEDSSDTTINNTDGAAQSGVDANSTDNYGAVYVFYAQ